MRGSIRRAAVVAGTAVVGPVLDVERWFFTSLASDWITRPLYATYLLLAYDDPLGVTAAFNKNLLVRLNRELDANFDVNAFDHRAVWNRDASRVEMHLVARTDQTIHIPGAHVDEHLQAGETIWTESSYKYVPEQIDDLLESCGFTPAAQWIDRNDGFALTMAEAF